MHPFFIPWCPGTSLHERLVRKHVPDSDPGWMVPATEFVIPAKAGIQRGRRGTNHTQTLPATRSHFHTLVCRHQPAWAIGTKTCPGLRPGLDGSHRHGADPLLALDERGLKSLPRTPIRGEGEPCSAGACPQPAGSGGRPATVTTAPTSSFRRRPESRGGIGGRHQFSYLGVPAATGAGDSYGTLPSLD